MRNILHLSVDDRGLSRAQQKRRHGPREGEKDQHSTEENSAQPYMLNFYYMPIRHICYVEFNFFVFNLSPKPFIELLRLFSAPRGLENEFARSWTQRERERASIGIFFFLVHYIGDCFFFLRSLGIAKFIFGSRRRSLN